MKPNIRARETTFFDLAHIDQLLRAMRRSLGLKKEEIVEITDGLKDVPGWQKVGILSEIVVAYC